jgi:hypothetical protein
VLAIDAMSSSQQGSNWLILHEVAHNTPVGDRIRKDNWRMYTRRGGYPGEYSNSREFFLTERATNGVARSIANVIGEEMMYETRFGE